MNPLTYFWVFLKASLFSTGGLGNLPFLNQDLISLGWAQPSDFLTAIAVGNVSPGPTGLWSVSLGYLTYGWTGSILSLIALTLPPLLILVVFASYNRIEHRPAVQDFSRGLALGVVGLAVTVTLQLARSSIIDWRGILVALVAMGLALSNRVPVIAILAIGGAAGVLFYGF